MKKLIALIITITLSEITIAQVQVNCRQGDPDRKPPTPEKPDPNPVAHSEQNNDAPLDPNEIVGFDGWLFVANGDTVRWVSALQRLPYTIYFENDPEQATAPAQIVTIRLSLDPLMNPADFGIGTFGFGNHVFPVEGYPLQYQTRLDLVDEMNLYIDVVAGIDITTNEAFWIFSSIDPATGVAPIETDRGFLPVNDSTHVGEGYVSFSIKPKTAQCHTGDSIAAQASIIFDVNEPIETNLWVNTIDAVAPTSYCRVLEGEPEPNSSPQETSDSLWIVFDGTDDTTGIAAYRLYYTTNGSAYRFAGRYLPGDTAIIEQQPNVQYTFFSIAEDNVGNVEPMKNSPDTLFGNLHVSLLASVSPVGAATIEGTGTFAVGDTAHLILHPTEGYTLSRWSESGIPQGTDTLLTLVADKNHTLIAEMERISYPLTVDAAEGASIAMTVLTTSGEAHPSPSPEGTMATYEAHHFDTLNIHLEPSPCYSNVAFSLNGEPLTNDTIIIVLGSIHLSSVATAHVDTGYVYDTVCPNTAYTANGFNILSSSTQTSGNFNFQLSTLNSQNCDSIAVLNLTVKPSHTLTFQPNGGTGTMPSQRVCSGEDVVLNRSTFTRDGYYFAGWATHSTDTTPLFADGDITNFSCDQTLYAVWSNSCVDRITSRIVTACDSLYWHGQMLTASGTYNYSTTGAVLGGCDSIYSLHLTVKQSTQHIQQVTTCRPYTWIDGQTYATDTIRQLSMTNAVGCDSLVTLQLVITDGIYTTETVTACDSYTWHDSTYTASTLNSQFSTLNSAGCDSTVTLHLTINNSTTGIETVTACDSYTWHDSTYTASTLNSQFSTLNSVGCDSTVTLHLTINNSTTGIETITACDSYTWHDSTYTASTLNSQFSTLNSAGCDSTVTLHLTINNSSTDIETATACDSYTWHDSTYTASTLNSQFSTLNSAGCDSTVTLHLTINYSTSAIETATACDSYTWHDSTYTASTLNSQFLTLNSVGCDSTVTLHLTINNSTTGIETITACDSYTWHDSTYTASTLNSQFSTLNSVGCDSTVTLHLTINNSTTGIETITACDSCRWHDSTYTTSTSNAQFSTLNVVGCDSTVTLHLTINYSAHDTIVDTAAGWYTWQGNTYTESGQYIFESQTEAGCDSVVVLQLTITEVGIGTVDSLGGIILYPNPTTGKVTIIADHVTKVDIFDQNGRTVATFLNTNEINIRHLPTGSYTLRITLHNGTTVKRVVKQ